jgi:hypothetical protein
MYTCPGVATSSLALTKKEAESKVTFLGTSMPRDVSICPPVRVSVGLACPPSKVLTVPLVGFAAAGESATVWKRRRRTSRNGPVRFGCSMVFTGRLWMDALQVPYGEVGEDMSKYRVLLLIRGVCLLTRILKGYTTQVRINN